MTESLLQVKPEELRVIDRHLIAAFGKAPWHADDKTSALIGTLSLRCSEAHSCIDLSKESDATREELLPSDLSLNPLIARAPKSDAPLVLDGEKLYTQRMWTLENKLASRLVELLHTPSAGQHSAETSRESLAAAVNTSFPSASREQVDAIVAMHGNRFHILQGGPGTGKTSCLAALLDLELQQNPSLNFKLAAPTGKAAARMKEAILSARKDMPASGPLQSQELESYTLHRLLGARPRQEHFKHNASKPIHCDLLVVDESGMIGLPLMSRLLDALPKHARLLLLGDSDQLSSVETGSVFSDLIQALPAHVAHLSESFRFNQSTHLGQFASAVRRQNLGEIASLLEETRVAENATFESGTNTPSFSWFQMKDRAKWKAAFLTCAKRLCHCDDDKQWEALSSFRLLSPLNRGPHGIHALNSEMELALQKSKDLSADPLPVRRPVRVRKNNRSLNIFNGDMGLITKKNEQSFVSFKTSDSSRDDRHIHLSSLPDLESAWAITVHAAQGDGYDHVFVVLPPDVPRSLSRELLFTAVTRAKTSVYLLANELEITGSVTTSATRQSGLVDQINRCKS
jgi:exodeoxyribonuclease V alpha subunit